NADGYFPGSFSICPSIALGGVIGANRSPHTSLLVHQKLREAPLDVLPETVSAALAQRWRVRQLVAGRDRLEQRLVLSQSCRPVVLDRVCELDGCPLDNGQGLLLFLEVFGPLRVREGAAVATSLGVAPICVVASVV